MAVLCRPTAVVWSWFRCGLGSLKLIGGDRVCPAPLLAEVRQHGIPFACELCLQPNTDLCVAASISGPACTSEFLRCLRGHRVATLSVWLRISPKHRWRLSE